MIHRLKSEVSNHQDGLSRNGVFHPETFSQAHRFELFAKASSTLTQIVRERPGATLVAGLIVGALIGYSIKRLK